jgi:hypothetical protein
LVPSSPHPPINKGIESAIDPSIKQEFFNTINRLCPMLRLCLMAAMHKMKFFKNQPLPQIGNLLTKQAIFLGFSK